MTRRKEERRTERARGFVLEATGVVSAPDIRTISRRVFNGGLAERTGNEGDKVK